MEYCFRENVSSEDLLDFYRRYTEFKKKLDSFAEMVDKYKETVLDAKRPTNREIYIRYSLLQSYFKEMEVLFNNLMKTKTFDKEYTYSNSIDSWL